MSIENLLEEGTDILHCKDYEHAKTRYDSWCNKIRLYARDNALSLEQLQELNVKMHFIENEYSTEDSNKLLRSALNSTLKTLERLNIGSTNESIYKSSFQVIENVLSNFYLHLKAMYKYDVHKRGSIKKEDLNKIVINNEYDVQRILYSLLLPLFPNSRTEVNGDNGYSGIRTDIFFEEYNLAIEIKCTRNNMSEKQLTEELGSDSFHYPVKTLYIFIYDKVGLIKNPTAYKMAFKRDFDKDGKNIRLFITQPVTL